MAATEPSKRRSVPVRLSDLSPELLMEYARLEARYARTQKERDDLMRAARSPTETVFYVTERLDAAA
jgi:hypothetical protein